MNQPYTCPVCEGRQIVSRWKYADNDGDSLDVHTVPCRSCKGTGVVWPPLDFSGDLIVRGNIVATGYREWMSPDQVTSLDLVTSEKN